MNDSQNIIGTEVEANLLGGGGKFRCIIRDKILASTISTGVTQYLVEITKPNSDQYKGQVLAINPKEVISFGGRVQ